MHDSTPEDGWLHIGLDDDGASLFIDPRSIGTRGGVCLDRLEVTVIAKPAEESDASRALQDLLSKVGKYGEEAAYVEQHWVLHLPRKLFAIRRFSVKGKDGATLHSVPLSDVDLSTIERGSAAEKVSQAVEGLLQDRSLVLQMPDAGLAAGPVGSRTSPTVGFRKDLTNPHTPRTRTGPAKNTVHRVASAGVWVRLLRRLRKWR
jgi:hypothetical protein